MNNIMIDIETLGTSGSAVILSIGAVAFTDHKLGKEFHTNIDIDSCLKAGMMVEGRTISWWMDQSAEARQLFNRTGSHLEVALCDLTDAFDWNETRVWSNGIRFDLSILDFAYRACDMLVPWNYQNEMDYRTIKNQLSKEVYRSLRIDPRIPHDALEDARAQAQTLIAINQRNVYELSAAA